MQEIVNVRGCVCRSALRAELNKRRMELDVRIHIYAGFNNHLHSQHWTIYGKNNYCDCINKSIGKKPLRLVILVRY